MRMLWSEVPLGSWVTVSTSVGSITGQKLIRADSGAAKLRYRRGEFHERFAGRTITHTVHYGWRDIEPGQEVKEATDPGNAF